MTGRETPPMHDAPNSPLQPTPCRSLPFFGGIMVACRSGRVKHGAAERQRR